MTMFFARGGEDLQLSADDLCEGLTTALAALGPRQRVLCVPPDFTRSKSQAGVLTCCAYRHYGSALTDVMPALGTHDPMQPQQLDKMFPSLPHERIRVHDWRRDVVTIGEVPAEFVHEATEGLHHRPWPAQLNKLAWHGQHDLILSIGQVVPHEVIGMANHNKNLFVGIGGSQGINESHFVGAVYGMERMMGRADTPLRRILNYAEREFCGHLPIVYALTVVAADRTGGLAVRGLFVGDDTECFERASELALKVNFTMVPEPLETVVVRLDAEEFHSTWLGNKAIYRTRMAIADGGHLVVLAPGVRTFGEDGQIDQLIRKYGYRSTSEILDAVQRNADLRENLSAAAHLIHGSPENRFRVTYCPGELSEQEVRSVGYDFGDVQELSERYSAERLQDGWNTLPDGERVYYISNPALGLWAHPSRMN
jgi:nickel-dependent lactate racemase